MRKFIISVLITILTLVLVACKSSDDSDGDNDSSIRLSQTVEFPDGYTMNYPDGWVTMTEYLTGFVIFASDQSMLDLYESGGNPESIKPGQALVIYSNLISSEGVSLSNLAASISSESMENAQTTELQINGNRAVSVSGQYSFNGVEAGAYTLLIDISLYDALLKLYSNDVIMMLTSITAPGEQDSLGETVKAIAVSYKPPGR